MAAPLRLLGRLLGVTLAALLLAGAGALWWVGQTTSFVRWALERAVSASDGALEVGTVQGTLAGGVRIASLRWHDAWGEVELRGLALAWRPERLLQRELRLTRVEIATVAVRLAPSHQPFALPPTLRLPMAVAIDALGIGKLAVGASDIAPIDLERVSLAARYRTGTYRIRYLAARSPRWGEASVRASLGDTAPYALELSASAAPRIEGWSTLPAVKILADGTLEDFALAAQALAPPGAAPSRDGAAPVPVWLALDTRVRPLARPAERLAPVQLTFNGVEPAQLGVPTALRARLSGSATVRIEPGRIAGKLTVRNALPAALDREALPLAALESDFAWSQGRLALDAVRATLAGGGTVEGEARLDPARPLALFGHALPAARVRLRVREVDLSAIASTLQATRLRGAIALDGTTLEIDLADASRRGIAAVARARIEGERLQVERARLETSAGTVSGRGRIGLAAPYRLDVSGEFDRIDPAAALSLQQALGGAALPPWLPAQRLGRLHGSLSGQWALEGTAWPEPALTTRLAIDRGVLDGHPLRLDWTGAVTRTRLAGVALALASGDLRVEARGNFGHAGDRLRWRVQAGSLARLDARWEGSASGQGVLSGGWSAAPPGLSGEATVHGLRWQDRLRAGTATVRIELPDFETGPVALRLDGTAVRYGDWPVQRLHLQLDGDLAAHRVQLELVAAHLSARASAHGALVRAPAWQWSGTIDALQAEAPVPLRLQAPVPLVAQAGGLALGEATLALDGGHVHIGALTLREDGIETRGEASGLPVARWARRYAETLGTGAAGAAAGASAEARAIADGVQAGFADLHLRGSWALAGASLRSASGRVTLQLDDGQRPGGGEADVRLDTGRLDGRIDLRIPSLAFANRLIGPEWAVAGHLRFAGSVGGTLASPRLRGELSGGDLALLQRALGWRLTGGTLEARFEGDRLELGALRLASGEGSITIDGSLALDDMRGDFRLRAERLPVPFGPGQRVVVSGDSVLASRGNALQWRGGLRVDEGLIELRGGDAPHLPEDVVIAGSDSGGTPHEGAAPHDDGLRIGADLTLDLGEQLRVRGSGIDVLLAGSLNLRGVLPAAPRAYGTVSVRKGTYSAYGQTLAITRGQIVFNGALDNPVLDIVAMRRDQPVQAGVSLTGTVLTPRVRLVSQPDVPDAQKLSWLVLGVGLDDARSGGQVAALQAAAATLFGQNDGGLAGGLSSALGLDLLAVRGANGGAVFDPNFGASFPGQPGTPVASAGEVGANVIALGKRLGSRVFVTYEQGLRGVWNVLRVQYDITHRLSLRAQTGTDSAVDLLYMFSFD